MLLKFPDFISHPSLCSYTRIYTVAHKHSHVVNKIWIQLSQLVWSLVTIYLNVKFSIKLERTALKSRYHFDFQQEDTPNAKENITQIDADPLNTI